MSITIESVQGLWVRQYLEVDGDVDKTTQVNWMQAGHTHIDLRLAPAFLELPAVPLYQQASGALLEIAAATAFAGVTNIDDCQCTWTRQINYQGPLFEPDVGVLSWSGDTLIEKGVHSAYEEGWAKMTEVPGRDLILCDESGCRLFLCVVADNFSLARANPLAMQRPLSLVDSVREALGNADESALLELFDQEFCFGKIKHGYGVISASTMPARVGAKVFRLLDSVEDMNAIDVLQQDFLGQRSCEDVSKSQLEHA